MTCDHGDAGGVLGPASRKVRKTSIFVKLRGAKEASRDRESTKRERTKEISGDKKTSGPQTKRGSIRRLFLR